VKDKIRALGERAGKRKLAAAAVPLSVLVLMVGLVTVTGGRPDPRRHAARSDQSESGTDQLEVGAENQAEPGESVSARAENAASAQGTAPGRPGGRAAGPSTTVAPPAPSAALPGVKGNEITVAYYWKGDRTRTSPYLAGSGFETNLDEGKAFVALIDFINRNSGTGKTLMGFPIDLRGRKLKPVVLEAGNSPEEYAAVARRLVEEVKPAIAISAHGSLSAYVCPQLARAGIHNLSTFDVAQGLKERTGGYCTPLGASWERQAEASTNYISGALSRSPYQGPEGNGSRKFGVVWAEYPGLSESAPRFVEGLRRAGVDVAATATLSDSLTEAQQQAGNAVARMRAAGVNTVVFPDSGAPLSFTQAAESQQYRPDYYVWPCSGQDLTAMVRLFNAAQWERARGLSCYDVDFQTDLANDSHAATTEWFKAYRSVRNDEPPASTGLVYQSLLSLIAGLGNAQDKLTVGAFRDGIAKFQPYRYSAVSGRTTDERRLLLDIGSADRSLVGDFTEVDWSSGARAQGSTVPGTYEYPGGQKRFRASHRW
jgi:ABC-type branched-subunit amino acid transport system substrate-binding protein